jgi:Carbohydrate-binding family 9
VDRRPLKTQERPFLEVPAISAKQRLVELPRLRLRDARDGGEPRLSTSVRVGWREGVLLVRFDARDAGVVATLTKRDAPLWTEDVLEVFLSPEDPPRLYYEFEVNPLGVLFDARVESPDLSRATMKVEPAWTCPGFSARVRRGPATWSALLRIPLSPMTPATIPSLWRANFYRVDRGQPDEYSAWSPTFTDPPDFHVPERFGFLSFQLSAHSSQL